jgi:L-glyceraldehyde 3-phosphate reductase
METPLEESMGALAQIVRQGKALYVGISSYDAERTSQAARILREMGTPCLIHQPIYNMFNRWIEEDLLNTLGQEGMGCIVFSPLAQGLLTDRYLTGIPKGSRAAKPDTFLSSKDIDEEKISKIRQLQDIAQRRGQKLAQMAIGWILRLAGITSVLVGTSKLSQLEENIASLNQMDFSEQDIQEIERILRE